MKTDYITRAIRFAYILAELFSGCLWLEDFEDAIERYNRNHKQKLTYANGVSRFVVIRSDYVIKFNMKNNPYWKWAGNNASECEVYAKAVADGFEYLLAKPTPLSINGFDIVIQPRVKGIDNEHRYYGYYCTYSEFCWLEDNIFDLHEGNVGYCDNKVCVVDYAAKMA